MEGDPSHAPTITNQKNHSKVNHVPSFLIKQGVELASSTTITTWDTEAMTSVQRSETIAHQGARNDVREEEQKPLYLPLSFPIFFPSSSSYFSSLSHLLGQSISSTEGAMQQSQWPKDRSAKKSRLGRPAESPWAQRYSPRPIYSLKKRRMGGGLLKAQG